MEFKSYIIIPDVLLFDENINTMSKIVFGIIYRLSKQKGYCFASNGYLAESLKVHPVTISQYISELVKSGYIEINEEKTTSGKLRKLIISDKNLTNTPKSNDLDTLAKTLISPKSNDLDPLSQTAKHNSIILRVEDNNIKEEENFSKNRITFIGNHNEKYITIKSDFINTPIFRINGVDGLNEYFEYNLSHNPRPEFANKFLISNNGRQFDNFKHFYNFYNKFIDSQFK